MNLISIELKHLLIKHKKHIGLRFQQNEGISNLLKSSEIFSWNNYYKMYSCVNTKKNLNQIFKLFNGIAWINGKYFFEYYRNGKSHSPCNLEELKNRPKEKGKRYCPEEFYNKLEIKHYSFNTCKTYVSMFEKFMNDHSGKSLIKIDEKDIQDYLNFLVTDGRSKSYINQMLNSIKFYYEIVIGMPNRFYSIDRPRKSRALPSVLSAEEICEMIKSASNLKHKSIIMLLYSAGLRRSELLNLKVNDIDSRRMVITIKDSKNEKDRITLLDQNMLQTLRRYYKSYKPKEYLFEGANGLQYSATSVGKIVAKYAIKAGITKKVTPHMLRHSFATHLLESGTDMRYIQSLLGHSSIRITEIYTYVATDFIKNIKSPLNFLNLTETHSGNKVH